VVDVVIVCPLHAYYSREHLTEVMATMRVLGGPVLRGHHRDGVVYLREGTHRIRAAWRLGLVPTIIAGPWWRSRQALANARHAADRRGIYFETVILQAPP
jgi:hypothetical protein